jgi:hypothetical protein
MTWACQMREENVLSNLPHTIEDNILQTGKRERILEIPSGTPKMAKFPLLNESTAPQSQ